jgi:hypothetical protein
MPEDSESQTLLALCGTAIEKWNEVAWMYDGDNEPNSD